MTPLIIAVVSIGAVIVLFAGWIVATYNGLVRRRVDCDNGWAQIDVQLKRRYDLIPNLVETVKGYAKHESGTLEAVIAARNAAVNVSSDAMHAAEKAGAENMLTQTLGKLFALSEAYPDLKANQNFAQLQEELTSTENKLGFARQHFNDTVARYEQQRQAFPPNIIAGMFNFTKREYFELDNEAIRETPKVSFS
jgi:LemA protein